MYMHKVKVSLLLSEEQAMKTYGKMKVKAPHILNLSRSVMLAPPALPPWKETQHTLDMRLGGPQSQF
jgi:hypothetical protein